MHLKMYFEFFYKTLCCISFCPLDKDLGAQGAFPNHVKLIARTTILQSITVGKACQYVYLEHGCVLVKRKT